MHAYAILILLAPYFYIWRRDGFHPPDGKNLYTLEIRASQGDVEAQHRLGNLGGLLTRSYAHTF